MSSVTKMFQKIAKDENYMSIWSYRNETKLDINNRKVKRIAHIFGNLRDFFFPLRERGRKGERDGEKHQSIGCLLQAPNQRPAQNSGLCPDQDSNQWPFTLWDEAQPTEPCWSGMFGNEKKFTSKQPVSQKEHHTKIRNYFELNYFDTS